jgi:hypothetical protein
VVGDVVGDVVGTEARPSQRRGRVLGVADADVGAGVEQQARGGHQSGVALRALAVKRRVA